MNRAAILFFCLGCAGCGADDDDAGKDAVTIAAVKGDLVFASSYYGEIEAKEAHPIFAPELRDIWQVTVETVVADGTEVKAGDTVLTFAKGAIEADLRDRETELLVAEASLRKVVADYDEQRISRTLAARRSELAVELAKMNVVEGVNLLSRIDVEKNKVELSRCELQLELDKQELVVLEKKRSAAIDAENITLKTARQKVEETKQQLSKMSVQAPADGILYAPYTRLNWVMAKVAPGKVVRPGDKLLEIPELDRFTASVYVRQREASNIKVGDSAVVIPTMFPDLRVNAKVGSRDEFATTRNERMGSSTPAGTLKELRVVLDLDEVPEQLRPGGTVRADISTVLAKDVVLVPLSALRELAGGARVVVKQDGTEVPVTVGQTSLTHAEITAGLAAGDEIRLDGAVPAATAAKATEPTKPSSEPASK
jgi:biotin carboxyl carrier protein